MTDASPPRRIKVGGAILAGGKSLRMGGIPKGLLKASPQGETIIARLIRELNACGIHDLIISANDPAPYRPFGLPILSDSTKGMGPLGGIAGALEYYRERCEGVLFVPCDLPGFTSREMHALLDAFIMAPEGRIVAARTGHFIWQPLCAVVHIAVEPFLQLALREGRTGIHRLWDELEAIAVDFKEETPFFNVNSQRDWDQWIKRRFTD